MRRPLRRAVGFARDPHSAQARYLLGCAWCLRDHWRSRGGNARLCGRSDTGDVMYPECGFSFLFPGSRRNKDGEKELDERAMKRMLEVGEGRRSFTYSWGRLICSTRNMDTAFAENC